MNDERQALFWSLVEKTETCWLWTRCASEYQYGSFL